MQHMHIAQVEKGAGAPLSRINFFFRFQSEDDEENLIFAIWKSRKVKFAIFSMIKIVCD